MHLYRTHRPEEWLSRMFDTRSAQTGGVVRRAKADVEREIGRERLELEVRRRGFHLIECDRHFLVICTHTPVRIIC